MGFFDNIANRVKSDMSYKIGDEISNSISKGTGKLIKKGDKKLTKCPKCKKPVSEGARVCGECGTKLIITCSQGHDNPYGTKFCTVCGEALK
jgi:hypothetical protein